MSMEIYIIYTDTSMEIYIIYTDTYMYVYVCVCVCVCTHVCPNILTEALLTLQEVCEISRDCFPFPPPEKNKP